MSALQSFDRVTGLPLDLEIDEHSRGKIMRTSILPFVVFSAALIRLALELVFDLRFGNITGFPGFGIFGEESAPPDVWARLYRVAYQLSHLEYVAVASLFAAGIFRWSRKESSWMLLIGGALAIAALLAGVVLAVLFLLSEDAELLYIDLRVSSFESLTESLGLLSIGYFFLAYRGLARRPQRRRIRRIRPRGPTPAPAPLKD